METVGVSELRRNTSAILRRVAAGEIILVTLRGQPVARLVSARLTGLARLEAEGRIRPGVGDLLDIEPIPLPPGARLPSELISEGRDE
jgi:prevent-host-death family protein